MEYSEWNEWYEPRLWITPAVSAIVDTKRFFIFSVLHNDSQKIAGLNFLDRVSGYDLQPLHECLVLFRRDLHGLFFGTGPAEAAKLQSFVKEKESVSHLSEYSDKKGMDSVSIINV